VACVQAIADLDKIVVVDRQWIDLSRKPFPSPTIGIFDRAFLPGRLWIAEPHLCPQAGLETGPIGELRASIEGDRAAARWGRDWSTWISPSVTGLDCRSLLRRKTAKRLSRSTSDVTLAFPNFFRNWIRSHSQWPNCLHSATTSRRRKMFNSGLKRWPCLRLACRGLRLARYSGRCRHSLIAYPSAE